MRTFHDTVRPALRSIIVLVLASMIATGTTLRLTAQTPSTLATVTVDAGHPWVATGLSVQKGDRLLFRTEGTIRWGSKPDQLAGPEGHSGRNGKLGAGGLIGRIGSTGKPFAIGKGDAPVEMRKSGPLFLGINDFVFGDNDGHFLVTVVRAP